MIRLLITRFTIILNLTKLNHFQITFSRCIFPKKKHSHNSPSLTCWALRQQIPDKEAIPSTTYRLGRRSLTGFFNSSTARKDNCSWASARLSDLHSTRRCLLEVEFLQITAFIHPFKSETERNETCGNLRRRGLELTLVVGWARTQQQQTVVGTAVVSRCSVKSNGQELLLQYKTIRERRSPFQEDADGDGGRP